MQDTDTTPTTASDPQRRAAERRRFLQLAGGGVATVGGLSLLAACGGSDDDDDTPSPTPSPTASPTPSPTPSGSPTASAAEVDTLNFALNLAYLEAQFYARAATGVAPATGLGTTPGAVTGGRQVTFADPVIAQYARELALDTTAHVAALRGLLGASAADQPAINIDGGASGAFTTAARAAGIVDANTTFDPYASDDNFLLSGFLLTDIAPTAYKGAITTLAMTALIDAAAGLHATKCYHAGLLRATLYARGATNATLRTNALGISNARDALDGTADYDQGLTNTDTSIANIVPADGNGLLYARTAGQVLNIAYLNKAAVTSGGFFPAGATGNVKTSAASG